MKRIIKVIVGLLLMSFSAALPLFMFFADDPADIQTELTFICSLCSAIPFFMVGVAIAWYNKEPW